MLKMFSSFRTTRVLLGVSLGDLDILFLLIFIQLQIILSCTLLLYISFKVPSLAAESTPNGFLKATGYVSRKPKDAFTYLKHYKIGTETLFARLLIVCLKIDERQRRFH